MAKNKKEEEIVIDDAYLTELFDRIHVTQSNIEDHLVNHPVLSYFPSVEAKIECAQMMLGQAYQEIGSIQYAREVDKKEASKLEKKAKKKKKSK